MGHGVLVQPLQCQICSTNTKSFFSQDQAKSESLQKLSPFIGVSHQFVLKSVKSLNRIFLAMEYRFKALECQIWSTNTKSFAWEVDTNLGTVQNLFPYIRVSYKWVLNSAKILNRFLSMIEYWFKDLKCQLCSTNTKLFSWGSEKNVGTLQKLSPYIGFLYKFILKSIRSSQWFNILSRL